MVNSYFLHSLNNKLKIWRTKSAAVGQFEQINFKLSHFNTFAHFLIGVFGFRMNPLSDKIKIKVFMVRKHIYSNLEISLGPLFR